MDHPLDPLSRRSHSGVHPHHSEESRRHEAPQCPLRTGQPPLHRPPVEPAPPTGTGPHRPWMSTLQERQKRRWRRPSRRKPPTPRVFDATSSAKPSRSTPPSARSSTRARERGGGRQIASCVHRSPRSGTPTPRAGFFEAFPRISFQETRERECEALGRAAGGGDDRTAGHRRAGGPRPASPGVRPALREEELPTWVCVWVAKGPPGAALTCTDNADGVGRSNGPTHRRSHRDPTGPSHRPSLRRSHRPTPQKPHNRHVWKPTEHVNELKSHLGYFLRSH